MLRSRVCNYLHTALEQVNSGHVVEGDLIYVSSEDNYYVFKNQTLIKICNTRLFTETLSNAKTITLHPLNPVYEYKIVEVSEEEWKRGLI